jgi:hypothetical protein
MQRTIRMSSLIFRPKHNTLARVTLVILAAGAGGTVGGLMLCARTPYARNMQAPIEQPLQFDHRHHTRDEGIDCRYCHNSVEKAPFAGIPPTQLCMNCHSQIWNKSPLLEPIRQSFFEDKPMVWNRVYKVPEFVYFNHAIHVNKGVGCVTCHGRVDQMAAVEKVSSLTMSWCLDCHRSPDRNLRPLEEITNMTWQPEGDPAETARVLAEKYDVHTRTSCPTCHR